MPRKNPRVRPLPGRGTTYAIQDAAHPIVRGAQSKLPGLEERAGRTRGVTPLAPSVSSAPAWVSAATHSGKLVPAVAASRAPPLLKGKAMPSQPSSEDTNTRVQFAPHPQRCCGGRNLSLFLARPFAPAAPRMLARHRTDFPDRAHQGKSGKSANRWGNLNLQACALRDPRLSLWTEQLGPGPLVIPSLHLQGV